MKLNLAQYIPPLALIAIAALGVNEIQAVSRFYWMAGKLKEQPASVQWNQNAEADRESLQKCSALFAQPTSSNEFEHLTTEWRQCHLDSGPAIRTAIGYMTHIARSATWLRTHSDDVQVRASAEEMLRKGRSQLLDDETAFHAPALKAQKVMYGSVMYRLAGGELHPKSVFEELSNTMDRLEIGLAMPELLDKQVSWRVQVRSYLQCIEAKDKCTPVVMETWPSFVQPKQ